MTEPRIVLAGSQKHPAIDVETLGAIDPSESAHVLVVLRRRSEPAPLTASSDPISYGDYVSAHGASASDFLSIAAFARDHNLDVREENAASRTLELHGTVSDLSKAFGVSLRSAHIAGAVYRVREGVLTIPASLGGVIQAVMGLDNRPVAKPHFRKLDRNKIRATAAASSLTALQVAAMYKFPAGLDGSGQTIAIIELDGGFLQSDLNTYFAGLHLSVPSVSVVLVDGQTNAINKHLPDHPELNADDEVALDIQVAGAVAPKAKQVVYFCQNSDDSWLKTLNMAVHGTPKPAAISISWGGPENQFTSQNLTAYEQAMQDAANLGIVVCVASGDNGSFDGTGGLMVDFPASAPHALGCGGTNLQGSGSSISSETVWNSTTQSGSSTVRIGTGGGVSTFFSQPSYQLGITVPPRPSGTGAGRGVPDVAGDADPATGYEIVVKGQREVVGGTSAVAPLWAGLIARFAQSLKGPAGFLHPNIYQRAVSKSGFQDVTKGNNDSTGHGGIYQAATGWDPCTGLGSPIGTALLKALKPASPAPNPPQPGPQPPHPNPPGPPPPHPGTGDTGTTGTTVSMMDFPPLPPPEPAPLPSLVSELGSGLLKVRRSNSIALVSVVGLAAVVGMVAATGLVATVAISKDEQQ